MGRARIAIGACFGTVLTIGLIAGGAAGQETGGGQRAGVELHGCGAVPEVPGFKCGSIRVPFERTDPSYGTTRIAFAVRERDQENKPSRGTIIAQEGGPGFASSGTGNAYVHLFKGLLKRRDLVLVDVRGTGRSQRIDCPELQHGVGPEFITLSDCAAQLGKRFISYRTSAAADDIDAVRKALGLGKVTLYGDSYGTYLGQSYAFRHPDTLRAVVLDSAYPARGESPWYGSLIRTGNESLALACRRSPRCHGDAERRLYKLVRYLRKSGRGVGGLLEAFGGATYGTPESYVAIDRAGVQLRRGNQHPWRRLTRPFKPTSGDPLEYVRAGELVVGCNDYPMIWEKTSSEPQRRKELREAIRRHKHDFGPFTPREIALSSSFGYLECLTWPKPAPVYEPPISPGEQPTQAPVLVVSGEMDNLTTPQEGRWVADEFPDAKRFVARNAGHVDSLIHHDGPAADAIRAFIRQHG